MRVNRDFKNEALGRWVETVPEDVLAALREGAEFDAKIIDAVRHGEQTDDPGDHMTAREFLAVERKG